MARTINIPEQVYVPGVYGPFEINGLGAGDNGFTLTMTRVAWPAGLVMTVVVEMTEDGIVWKPWVSQSFEGGVHLNRQGGVLAADILQCSWPGENDGAGGRKVLRKSAVRLSATVVQTITTAITLVPF